MSGWFAFMRRRWIDLLASPWRFSGDADDNPTGQASWLLGWAWTLAGATLGAFVGQYLVLQWGVPSTVIVRGITAQLALMFAVATIVGFVVQVLGFTLLYLALTWMRVREAKARKSCRTRMRFCLVGCLVGVPVLSLIALLPFAAVGYTLYLFWNWAGPGKSQVIAASVGAVFVTVVLIPVVQSIVTGVAVRWLIRVLSGEKQSA